MRIGIRGGGHQAGTADMAEVQSVQPEGQSDNGVSGEVSGPASMEQPPERDDATVRAAERRIKIILTVVSEVMYAVYASVWGTYGGFFRAVSQVAQAGCIMVERRRRPTIRIKRKLQRRKTFTICV